MVDVIFYDIQEHGAQPLLRKNKPIFNQPKNNLTSTTSIQKNDFVIFNVKKEFKKNDIIKVITEITKIDISKIYRPPCCECIQFPNNTWFITTLIQLKKSDFDKIEAALEGTLLPRAIQRKSLTDPEIIEELSIFNKGTTETIQEEYYENRPTYCDEYRDDYHHEYHYDYKKVEVEKKTC